MRDESGRRLPVIPPPYLEGEGELLELEQPLYLMLFDNLFNRFYNQIIYNKISQRLN